MKKEWEVWSQRSEWSVEMTGSQSSEDEGLYEETRSSVRNSWISREK